MISANPLDTFPYPPTSPYVHGAAVTPSDAATLGYTTRGLWIGGAGSGNLKVVMAGDATPVTLIGVPVGLLHISVVKVFNTGTDVTDIVALW